jgi:hypothetical protein
MLGASVSYAQTLTVPPYSQTAAGQAELANRAAYLTPPYEFGAPYSASRSMHVACWAEVPSHNTAYFSATFAAPSVYNARKEFRQLVTAQIGPVSKLQCAGKFSETVVNERVEEWKDSARSTKNAIVDTDWRPDSPLTLSSVVSPPPFVPELQ